MGNPVRSEDKSANDFKTPLYVIMSISFNAFDYVTLYDVLCNSNKMLSRLLYVGRYTCIKIHFRFFKLFLLRFLLTLRQVLPGIQMMPNLHNITNTIKTIQ